MKYRKLLIKFVLTIVMIAGTSLISHAQRDSLTIEVALDIAEESNPSLKNSKLNLERSQWNLAAQRASLKSRFSLNLNPVDYGVRRSFDNRTSEWFKNETFSTGGNFRVVQPILPTDGTLTLSNTLNWQYNRSEREVVNMNRAFVNNLSLRLDQPIFTYNTRRMDLKRLEFDYENAGISYALARLSAEVNISRQFYAVFMAQNNLEIRKQELENARQSYEIIQNKVAADLAAREELFQAEVNFATAQSSVENQLANLENAKDALKQALGMPLDEDIRVKGDIQVNTVLVSLDQAVGNGMASRMELRQREIDNELQEMQMIQTKAMNEFRGNVSLSLGVSGDNEYFGNMFDRPTLSPQVSISFQVPIFDWGERRARIKAQETAQVISKLRQDNEKIDIEIGIRQVIREIERIRNQIEIEEKSVQAAQLTYDVNLIRYREGDLTGMQINQFQTQLSSRRISYSQMLIDYKIALLNLKILSLYDFENDEPVVPVMGL
jgi:outer membrane protein TolC